MHVAARVKGLGLAVGVDLPEARLGDELTDVGNLHVQQRLAAVQAAIIIAMEPVFAALFGYVCVGDRLVWTQWLGALLMIGAMVFSEVLPAWRRRK